MKNLVVLVALVFPGFLAVLATEFLTGRRGLSSADRVLLASLYSILASVVLILVFGYIPFAGITFAGVEDVFSGKAVTSLVWLTSMSTVMALGWTAVSRSRWFRTVCRRIANRTFTYDILYDKYLDVIRVMKSEQNSGRLIVIVRLKSGFYLKGEILSLSDTQSDRGMFLSNPDLYDGDLKLHAPLDVFLRDKQDRYADGVGVYLRRAEIEMVWLGIDEIRFLKFRKRYLKELGELAQEDQAEGGTAA